MIVIKNTLLTTLVFLLLFVGFFHEISAINQDLGRHLITGKIIIETGAIPKANLFSYTYPDFPFINHHWLSEVLFYLIYTFSGFNGLLLFTILVITVAFGLLFFSTFKKTNIFALSVVSLLYLRVLFERTDVRPEIFSFLFLSIFIFILYRYREKYTRWIFLLPFLEFLWVNIHIYFIIGIGIIGLFLIDYLIKNRKQLNHHYTSILVVVLLACGFSTLLNPNGIQGALYPFHVFQNYGYTIEENQTVFFLWNYFGGKTTILYFFISVAALFSILLLTFKKTRPIDWLLALFFTAIAISAERNLPLFVFGTFIPLANSLTHIKLPSVSHRLQAIATIIITVILIWQITGVSSQKPLGFGQESGAKNAADFFLQHKLRGPLFNNFDIGSYLEYRLYPNEKVFVDGRPEAYPSGFFQKVYIPMQDDPEIFEKTVQQYRINSIFFAHTDQTPWATSFLQHVLENPRWSIIYSDEYVVILVRNTKANSKLIKQFGRQKEELSIRDTEKRNMRSLLRLSSFFQKTGLEKQEAETYLHILALDPSTCFALRNLSLLLGQEQNPLAEMYTNKFLNNCH